MEWPRNPCDTGRAGRLRRELLLLQSVVGPEAAQIWQSVNVVFVNMVFAKNVNFVFGIKHLIFKVAHK